MRRPLERIWDWLLARDPLLKARRGGRVGRPTVHDTSMLSGGIYAVPNGDGAWAVFYRGERWLLLNHGDRMTPMDLLDIQVTIDQGVEP